MPNFPRDKKPRICSPPEFPEAYAQWAPSGKGQFRSAQNAGRIWQEVWPAMNYKTADIRKLLRAINQGLREKIIWDIQHRHLLANYGTATGTCSVSGSGQTGDTLTVSGLSGTLYDGDIIQIAGDNLIYDVRANSSGSTIYISPPIFEGNSPSGGATVQVEADNCWFKAVIIGVDMPDIEADGLILPGLTVTFREQP